MPEQDKPKSLEKRIAACPIHQWADIDGYLERAQVPEHLWRPFHELLLTRGELPKNMSADDGKLFGKRAVEITHEYQVQPMDGQGLKIMFGQLVEQWLAQGAENN